MASELVSELIAAGIHYGHRVSRWNPKMKPYIFGKRNTIHLIDIRETVKGLLRAKKFIARIVAGGGDVLFVGTKRQARPLIVEHATRVKMPYVSERWLGGTLTNFRTIRARLGRLDELETAEADGTALQYSKKMISSRARELRKIKRNLDGIRQMDTLPEAIIVIDVHREYTALREARKLKIPTVCLIDTDSDPDYADLPIPGNDDAMKTIELVLSHLTEAVELGMRGRTLKKDEEGEPAAPRRQAAHPPLASASAGGEVPGAKPATTEEQVPAPESTPPAPQSGVAATAQPELESST